MNISPVDDPIHHDFFSVVGSGIPSDAVLEFTTQVGVMTVSPTFIRPHLALVERLPSSLPVGAATLRLISPTSPPSNSVLVTVLGVPAQTIRLLQPGATKTRPYTMVFVANPGIEAALGGTFSVDPILSNRSGFHHVVGHCFRNLFGVAEDLLRQGNIDTRMRIVAVFDPSRPANAANSLAHEIPGSDVMETRRSVLAPFLSIYGIVADIVFVIHGSTTHKRASAWFTSDDQNQAGTSYSFDNVSRTHGHFPRIPGSAAIPVFVDVSGLTVIHEFGHAASDIINGKVVDLYNDGGNGAGFLINKKFRSQSGAPVPTNFATYHGTQFGSDQARDGLGYPSDWRTYHPTPTDATRPNLMDNYWKAYDNPQLCRFDQLTYTWFKDRLNAKLAR